MTEVIHVERKSTVLAPSSLACIMRMPTVNLTAGCAHECCYCYARGYRTYPGEGTVRFYTNTLAKLEDELRRKRRKPAIVCFSPSSDPFQPIPEVLETAYDVFKLLLESKIGVVFLTKGRIPRRHRELLAAHPRLVQGRIGLVTLDAAVAAAFEPYAATPEDRLAEASELICARVPVEARLDPILPGVTDGPECLEPLCASLAHVGVRKVSASVLLLRPAVTASLRRHVKDKPMLFRLLERFAHAEPLAIHAGKRRVRALPASERREIFERLEKIARSHGLHVRICACKNPDLPSGSCHLPVRWRPAVRRGSQLLLFQA
jgi:DNA repair photolyase